MGIRNSWKTPDAKLQAPQKSTSTILRRWIAQRLILLKLDDDLLLHTSTHKGNWGGFFLDDDKRMRSTEPLLHIQSTTTLMKSTSWLDLIHELGKEGQKKREKGKIKEYENLRKKILWIFLWQIRLKETYDELLDVESVALEPVESSFRPWMETPSMDLSSSRVQHIQESPSVYFIPFS